MTARCLACCAVLTGGLASGAETAGRVFDVQGDWHSSPARALRTGAALQPGDRLRPASSAYSIDIALLDGSEIHCSSRKPCAESGIVIPAVEPPARGFLSTLGALWDAAFQHEPPPMIFAIARGGQPREAVLLCENGRADVAPALATLDPGRYRLRFTPRAGGAPAQSACDWSGGNSAVPVDLAPGLYEMSVANETGEPEGGPAIVLVKAEPGFAAARKTFEDAREHARQWRDASLPAQRRFLAAILYGLERRP